MENNIPQYICTPSRWEDNYHSKQHLEVWNTYTQSNITATQKYLALIVDVIFSPSESEHETLESDVLQV